MGGGHKKQYRIIDFKRDKDGIPAVVKSIEYDPNRTARIALVYYADGEKRYIIYNMAKKRRKKKSYNPFKMWGSWVGLFIVIIIMTGIILNRFGKNLDVCFGIQNDILGFAGSCTFITFPLTILSGFLIGWGIHSLFRKFSK